MMPIHTFFPRTILWTYAGLAVLLSRPGLLRAQEQEEMKPAHPSIYYEALNFISADTSKSQLEVNFNLSLDFFIFVRSLTNTEDFIARGEVSIEVLNSQDLSVAREILRKEFHRTSAVVDPNNGMAVQGSVSFTLPPATYHVVFEVNDLESKRRFVDRKQILLKRYTDSTLGISDILFLERFETQNDTLTKVYPVNLGGDAIFGRNFTLFFQTKGGNPDAEMLHYSLHKLGSKGEKTTVFSDSTKPIPDLSDRHLVHQDNDSVLVYTLEPGSTMTRVSTYLVEIRADTLSWGQYDIEVRGARNLLVRKTFAIRWLEMPRTLRSTALSSEALVYLMSDDEFDDFMKTSREEMKKQFEEFWKKRDPTPQTAYNEAMAEYYRRCDYALENFSTVSQQNGIKSDRGKVYILYGPPTKTDRLFIPNSVPEEVWFYNSLNMKFIFQDESRVGNYKLISSEKL